MSTISIAIVAALVLSTSFLSGIFGMAGGMILMGGLVYLMPVPAAMMLHGVTQMTSNGWRALLWSKYIYWKLVFRYAIGLVIAAFLFSLVQFVPDKAVVLITLGAMPFSLYVIPDEYVLQADRRYGSEICGFISTIIQLITGVSGPTLDLFYVRTTLDRRNVVATKAACQVLSHLTKLVYFGSVGSSWDTLLNWPVMALCIGLAIVGTTTSRVILERLTDVQFRLWTRRIVMTVGAIYVVQGVITYFQ